MKTESGRDINAMGYGDQNKSFPEGNNSKGVFEQSRPTGIIATGQKRGELRNGITLNMGDKKGKAGRGGK